MNSWKNWANLSKCEPKKIQFPKSLSDLKQIITETKITKETLKVVGHGNSYNTNFHTEGTLVSLKDFNTIQETNIETQQVSIEATKNYGTKHQQTIDEDGNATTLSATGRHDPCVLPRAVPMVEAMVALVLADHLLRQKGQCS